MKEHREKYGALLNRLGFDKVRALLPPQVYRQEDAARLIAADEHLNNVGLSVWDRRHHAMFQYYRESTGEWSGWSLCDTVCTLKECARQVAEGRTE